jgi:hypothetical protein
LSSLTKKIDDAISQGDSEKCYSLCIEILKWGGVDQENKAQNIRELGQELASYLGQVRSFLNNKSLDSESIFEYQSKTGKVFGLNLDSGTTKIYSLIANNFIIYDSRVGAALCMLVRAWYDTYSYKAGGLSELMMFTWGSARKKIDGIKTSETRSPNNGKHPRMLNFHEAKKQNPVKRFSDNVHSSWLLSKLLENDDTCGGFASFPESQRVHAFESALFMIGYSVSDDAFEKMEQSFNSDSAVREVDSKKQAPTRSKKEIATELFRSNPHLSRRDLVALFESEAKLTKKGASTYYYNISRELG